MGDEAVSLGVLPAAVAPDVVGYTRGVCPGCALPRILPMLESGRLLRCRWCQAGISDERNGVAMRREGALPPGKYAAKLSMEIADTIRQRLARGEGAQALADEYGVTLQAIHRIKWKTSYRPEKGA